MTVCSLISFIPGGYIAGKLGRRNTVLLGLGLMIISLLVACFVSIPWVLYILIAIAGIGWAWVNVNSYPMVVEMASKKTVGKLTGWYYSASMLAQSLTPICVGFFFKALGFQWLFPYATIFAVIALIVFLFYKQPAKSTVTTQIEQKSDITVNTETEKVQNVTIAQEMEPKQEQKSEEIATQEAETKYKQSKNAEISQQKETKKIKNTVKSTKTIKTKNQQKNQ